nr:ferredoxin [Sphingomonas sp. CDS-1]
MRVSINRGLCQGHAMCWLTCPEVFRINDEDGHAYLESELVPEGFEEKVDQAQRCCPEGAIIIHP